MDNRKLAVMIIAIIIAVILFATVLYFSLDSNKSIACTSDAKVCPDGSAVGKDHNNNCEFFPCPDLEKHFCTPEQRNVGACIEIYQPVCGWNDPEKIQCIKWPCASTYSNSCFACDNEDVLYWTAGECPEG